MAVVAEARWADVLLIESPPLFLGATAAWLRAAARRPYLFHVADPWPDFPVAMGMLRNPLAQRAAYALEDLAYRRAGLVTTVSPGLVELLAAKPSAHGKVRLLPNGVDVRRFEPDTSPRVARARLGWHEAAFTLAYVGTDRPGPGGRNPDRRHRPARRPRDRAVHLVGEGAERDPLRAHVEASGLHHVHFEPAVTADQVRCPSSPLRMPSSSCSGRGSCTTCPCPRSWSRHWPRGAR